MATDCSPLARYKIHFGHDDSPNIYGDFFKINYHCRRAIRHNSIRIIYLWNRFANYYQVELPCFFAPEFIFNPVANSEVKIRDQDFRKFSGFRFQP
jgi:hypothetical protein